MISSRIILLVTVLIFTQGLRASEIQDAVRAGDLAKVKTLVEATPTLLQSEAGSWTLLHEAARAGQKEVGNISLPTKST